MNNPVELFDLPDSPGMPPKRFDLPDVPYMLVSSQSFGLGVVGLPGFAGMYEAYCDRFAIGLGAVAFAIGHQDMPPKGGVRVVVIKDNTVTIINPVDGSRLDHEVDDLGGDYDLEYRFRDDPGAWYVSWQVGRTHGGTGELGEVMLFVERFPEGYAGRPGAYSFGYALRLDAPERSAWGEF